MDNKGETNCQGQEQEGGTTGRQQIKLLLLISVLIKTLMVCAPCNLNHVVTSLLGSAMHATKFKVDIKINNLGEPHILGR